MDKDNVDPQLVARGEWAKFQSTGNIDSGDIALTLARGSGYNGDEKSPLIKNTPELSKAFDEGRKDNSTDWAIKIKESAESESHYFNKFGPEIKPALGTTYEGPIVYGDSKSLYQAAKVNGDDVLVVHERTALSSVQPGTLAGHDKPVNIKYLTEGVGVAKPAIELVGPKAPEYQPRGGPGMGAIAIEGAAAGKPNEQEHAKSKPTYMPAYERAVAGKTYEGKVVGFKENQVIQQIVNGDKVTHIAHERSALSSATSGLVHQGKDLSIRYPFAGVGIVKDRQLQHEQKVPSHQPKGFGGIGRG